MKKIGLGLLVIAVCASSIVFAPSKTVKSATNTSMHVTSAIHLSAEATETTKEDKIKLSTPKLKIKKRLEKKVKLDWSGVDNAQRYIVLRAQKGKGFVQIKKVTKSSFTDKKAKKRKTYKYKIVAEAKKDGMTFTSKASKAKKVYVLPKNPKTVICGECFVEGMKMYANKYKPKKTRFVYKIGLSTSGMINTNYIKYGGQTITALERIAYYKPDRVFFLIGMNEAKNGSPKYTVKNYKRAYKLLKKVNPHIEVVLMALPPVGRSHGSGFASNGQINRYNRAYKAFAKKTKNVFYYGSYRRLITDGAGYLKGGANGGDGGHWSSSGTIKVVKHLKKYSKALTKR